MPGISAGGAPEERPRSARGASRGGERLELGRIWPPGGASVALPLRLAAVLFPTGVCLFTLPVAQVYLLWQPKNAAN